MLFSTIPARNRVPRRAGTFLVGGFALVGIPPLSGLFAKLFVFQTAIAGDAPVAFAIAVIGAVLSLAYISRAWDHGFWGEGPPGVHEMKPDYIQILTVSALALAVISVGVRFNPIVQAAE